MYIAELKGKIPSSLTRKEDLLTSNVFSFFKYADRKTFLKPFLKGLNFAVSDKDVSEAEFLFWPTYEDRTEPDVVLIVGPHYILFEAKYFSGFGEETELYEDQLTREMKMGSLNANRLGKKFCLVAVTADYSEPKKLFMKIKHLGKYLWISWHDVTLFLERTISAEIKDREFAEDLYSLLIKKNLRIFDGYQNISVGGLGKENKFVFFDYIDANYRGAFIGFLNAYSKWLKKIERYEFLFFNMKKNFSWGIEEKQFYQVKHQIYFGGKHGQKND